MLISIFFKLLFSYLSIGLNDIGIKLFAGGVHDMESIGWVNMLLFFGLISCCVMLIIADYRDKMFSICVKILGDVSIDDQYLS